MLKRLKCKVEYHGAVITQTGCSQAATLNQKREREKYKVSYQRFNHEESVT